MTAHSIFWRLNAFFLTFAAFLALLMGIFCYAAADRFSLYLIKQQAQPIMHALVTAEQRWRDGPDRNASDAEINALAASVGATFLVGKQVPPHWQEQSPGLHVTGGSFVYLEREDGITYALFGTSFAMTNFLHEIAWLLILAGVLGLVAAILMGAVLGRHLADPLMQLARIIDASHPGEIVVPQELTARKDEIGRVARAMVEHADLARDYYRRETAFTGDVSHELRTPLAILTSTTEILSTQIKEERLRKVLERLDRTVRGMSATVQSLLSLARKNCPKPRLIPLANVLQQQLDELRQAKLCPPEIKITVCQQPQCLGQPDLAATAVSNVLRNACRYTEDGEVRVTLEDKFLRVANNGTLAATRNPDSCGLGLSIASRCCEKMGWQLELTERDGEVAVRIIWKT